MTRLLLSLVLALTLAAASWAEPPKSTPIKSLKVVVRTFDDWGAGTTDAVWLSLGESYEWTLDLPGEDAFKPGRMATFVLPPQGLKVEDIEYVRVRKSRGGDDWTLQGVEVWINGKPWYRNNTLNLVLDDNRLEWTSPPFKN